MILQKHILEHVRLKAEEATEAELFMAYGKDPDAPATWINKAMLEPFDLAKTIAEDPGKHKDVAERVNALGREMPKLVREGLHAAHEIHQQRLESVALAAQHADGPRRVSA